METQPTHEKKGASRANALAGAVRTAGDPSWRPGFLQPKLSVNKPDDAYEREADKVAEQVVQRKCAHCEEEEKKLQKKEDGREEKGSSPHLENYIGSLNGTGQPLSAEARGYFEPRFGRDFSNVKVHTDGKAAESSRSINAQAYTAGNNIVFNAGKYAPQEEDGKKLLAHELTHVVQQGAASGDSGNGSKQVHRKPETRLLPGWGNTMFGLGDDSKMTINPVAKLIVDGMPEQDNWDLTCNARAAFIAPKCTKSGEVQIVVGGYWFQNNTLGNKSGQGQTIVRAPFDVNEKGMLHFRVATTSSSVNGAAAQMVSSGAASDNPPDGGSLVAQVGIISNTSTNIGVSSSGGISISAEGVGGSGTFGSSQSATTGSGNSFSCGYAVDVKLEKKVMEPMSKTQPVYFKVGKHKVIGSRDSEQPSNIKDIYAFLNTIPPAVRQELEDGKTDLNAQVSVVAQASVTTPNNPEAGSNLALTEKRRDSVVRVLQDFFGGGAKIKAKALGELAAVDPGESDAERVATITISWENDPCLTNPADPAGSTGAAPSPGGATFSNP